MDFINQHCICGDSLEGLKKVENNSIQLVLTSPPYGDMRNYSKVAPQDYVDWFLPWAHEIKRVLKEDGSFILNINDQVIGGAGGVQSHYVHKLVISLIEDVGFNYIRDYIWFNPATPPNIYSKGTYGRTKKSHEYIFWFSKSDKWKFNMDNILKPYSESTIRFMKKKERKTVTRASGHNFRLDGFKDRGGADPGSVMIQDVADDPLGSVLIYANTDSNSKFRQIVRKCKTKFDMAIMPEKVAEFFVLAATDPGDIVLDPFLGTGTTVFIANKNKRVGCGWDIHQEFVDISKERLLLLEDSKVTNTDE